MFYNNILHNEKKLKSPKNQNGKKDQEKCHVKNISETSVSPWIFFYQNIV